MPATGTLFPWTAQKDLIPDPSASRAFWDVGSGFPLHTQSIERKTGDETAKVKQSPSEFPILTFIPLKYVPMFGDYFHGNHRSTLAVCAIFGYCMVLTLASVLGLADGSVYALGILQMLALPATVSNSVFWLVMALLESAVQIVLIVEGEIVVPGIEHNKIPFLVFVGFQIGALLTIPLWQLYTWAFGAGVGFFDSPVGGEVTAVKAFEYAVKVVRWRSPFRFSEWKAINKHKYDHSRLNYFSQARRWCNEIVSFPFIALGVASVTWNVPHLRHPYALPLQLPLLFYIASFCGISVCVFIGLILFPIGYDLGYSLFGTHLPIFIAAGVSGSLVLLGHAVQTFIIWKRCEDVQRGKPIPVGAATPYLATFFIGSTIMGHTISFFVLCLGSYGVTLVVYVFTGLSASDKESVVGWIVKKLMVLFGSAIAARLGIKAFMSRIVTDETDIRKPFVFSMMFIYVSMASTIAMLTDLIKTLALYVICLPLLAMFPLYPLFSVMPTFDTAYTGLWATLAMHNSARNPLKVSMIGYMLARSEIRSFTQKAVRIFGLDWCVRASGLGEYHAPDNVIAVPHTTHIPSTIREQQALPTPPHQEACMDRSFSSASDAMSTPRDTTHHHSNNDTATTSLASPTGGSVTERVIPQANEPAQAANVTTPVQLSAPEALEQIVLPSVEATASSAETTPSAPQTNEEHTAPDHLAVVNPPSSTEQSESPPSEEVASPTPEHTDADIIPAETADAENAVPVGRSESETPEVAPPPVGDQPETSASSAQPEAVPSSPEGVPDAPLYEQDESQINPPSASPSQTPHISSVELGTDHEGASQRQTPADTNQVQIEPFASNGISSSQGSGGNRYNTSGTQCDETHDEDYVRLSDFGNTQRFAHLAHSIRIWVLFRSGLLSERSHTAAYLQKETVNILGNREAEITPWPHTLDEMFLQQPHRERQIAAMRLQKALSVNALDREKEHIMREEIRERRSNRKYLDSYQPLGLDDGVTSYGGEEEQLDAQEEEDGEENELYFSQQEKHADSRPEYNFSHPLPRLFGSVGERIAAAINMTNLYLFSSLPGHCKPDDVTKESVRKSQTGLVRAIFHPSSFLIPVTVLLQTSEARDMLSELQHRYGDSQQQHSTSIVSQVNSIADPILRAKAGARLLQAPYRRKLRVANRWLMALLLLRYPQIRCLRKHALRKSHYTPSVPMLRGVLESHCGKSGGWCCCCACVNCE